MSKTILVRDEDDGCWIAVLVGTSNGWPLYANKDYYHSVEDAARALGEASQDGVPTR